MSAAKKPFPQLHRNPGSQGNERPIEILPVEDGRADYGSALRDAAALVTLASESGAPTATITGAVERVANEFFLQGTFILGAHPTERF